MEDNKLIISAPFNLQIDAQGRVWLDVTEIFKMQGESGQPSQSEKNQVSKGRPIIDDEADQTKSLEQKERAQELEQQELAQAQEKQQEVEQETKKKRGRPKKVVEQPAENVKLNIADLKEGQKVKIRILDRKTLGIEDDINEFDAIAIKIEDEGVLLQANQKLTVRGKEMLSSQWLVEPEDLGTLVEIVSA